MMEWDSIRWDKNQLETSIGMGFVLQFLVVNLEFLFKWDLYCSFR